jgi:AraC family transcriptional regulator of adaptative response / methylphosphotriester-DNA alkyltransferase methyltransferase
MTDERALLELELPAHAESAAAARKALASLNGRLHLVSTARLGDVQQIVTELVANALAHGAPSESIRLQVHATGAVLRIAVEDMGGGFEPQDAPKPSHRRGGGWGLPIVGTLAHRWGVERSSVTRVWFEVDDPGLANPVEHRHSAPEPTVDPRRGSTVELYAALFAEATAIVAREHAQALTLAELARLVATSPRQLQRAFAMVGDTTFRAQLTRVRMERAAELLTGTSLLVQDVAHAVGYREASHFAKAFRRHHGASPSDYRARKNS